MRLAIIADDLTGAADAAATFATHGFATAIAFTAEYSSEFDVVVRSTESREADLGSAVHDVVTVTNDLVRLPGGSAPRLIYKKIDSVLRGHPREEFFAVLRATGERRALLTPALPSEGRQTMRGHHYVDGVPLGASSFGGPGVTSDLSELFRNDDFGSVRLLDLDTIRAGKQKTLEFLNSSTVGIVIADAETDEDLRVLASAAIAGEIRVMAGSAGLARQLALTLQPETRRSLDLPSISGPILVVAGSRHDTTAIQVAAMRDAGHPVVTLAQNHLDDRSSSVEQVIGEVASLLLAGKSVVLTTAGLASSKNAESFVVSRLATIAADPRISCLSAGLVLTGGDVAAGVLSALGATSLRLGGEIRPTMPWGMLELADGRALPVATKAGSFGERDALLAAVSSFGARQNRECTDDRG
jgi:uncharacterized protein YgbK (DUF1537 family)